MIIDRTGDSFFYIASTGVVMANILARSQRNEEWNRRSGQFIIQWPVAKSAESISISMEVFYHLLDQSEEIIWQNFVWHERQKCNVSVQNDKLDSIAIVCDCYIWAANRLEASKLCCVCRLMWSGTDFNLFIILHPLCLTHSNTIYDDADEPERQRE